MLRALLKRSGQLSLAVHKSVFPLSSALLATTAMTLYPPWIPLCHRAAVFVTGHCAEAARMLVQAPAAGNQAQAVGIADAAGGGAGEDHTSGLSGLSK